jgi:hypothetical protein
LRAEKGTVEEPALENEPFESVVKVATVVEPFETVIESFGGKPDPLHESVLPGDIYHELGDASG